MPNRVRVLDTNRRALAPCHPARAKILLRKGKASVLHMQPFTIILHRGIPPEEIVTDNLEVKTDQVKEDINLTHHDKG